MKLDREQTIPTKLSSNNAVGTSKELNKVTDKSRDEQVEFSSYLLQSSREEDNLHSPALHTQQLFSLPSTQLKMGTG